LKFMGFMLLVAGWIIAVAAVPVLRAETPRAAFALAGAAVEILGLVLIVRSQPVRRGEQE
jgi:hypothetical protein